MAHERGWTGKAADGRLRLSYKAGTPIEETSMTEADKLLGYYPPPGRHVFLR